LRSGVRLMLGKFRMQADVTSFDVGQTRHLKYSMILRFLQEAAGRQLEREGLSYERMRESGVVFLLTSVNMQIRDLPKAGETITIETWFHTLRGAKFERCMRMLGQRGQVYAEGESLWVTVNPETHRIIRPTAFPFHDLMRETQDDTFTVPLRQARAVELPETGVQLALRPVRWSDIDCNGHMNNAVYADLICDHFPGGLGLRRLAYFAIEFSGEAAEGSQIAIRSAMTGEKDAAFEGKFGDKLCFKALAGCV
jgi:medium-chain acyl-[acyl-carrier-protein] hydrolase